MNVMFRLGSHPQDLIHMQIFFWKKKPRTLLPPKCSGSQTVDYEPISGGLWLQFPPSQHSVATRVQWTAQTLFLNLQFSIFSTYLWCPLNSYQSRLFNGQQPHFPAPCAPNGNQWAKAHLSKTQSSYSWSQPAQNGSIFQGKRKEESCPRPFRVLFSFNLQTSTLLHTWRVHLKCYLACRWSLFTEPSNKDTTTKFSPERCHRASRWASRSWIWRGEK